MLSGVLEQRLSVLCPLGTTERNLLQQIQQKTAQRFHEGIILEQASVLVRRVLFYPDGPPKSGS